MLACSQGAAYGGATLAESIVLLTCPAGPIPLAARGLAAVLARAGPAGAGGDRQTSRHCVARISLYGASAGTVRDPRKRASAAGLMMANHRPPSLAKFFCGEK